MRLLRSLCITIALAGALVVPACASMVSTQQEVQMGLQAAEQIEAEIPVIEDPVVDRYVTALGARLLRGAGDTRDVPYQFRVVDTPQVNAFAIPGGFIYVTRGLIEQARTMSELAGPMAHEIAHVEHRHSVEQLARMQQTELGATLAYVLLGRTPGEVDQAVLGLGAGAYFASYSRDHEREADASAIEYMTRAGIDPNGLMSFFQTLAESEGERGLLDRWFATHPMTEDRVEATRAAIAAKPGGAQLQQNDAQFAQVKARLRALPRSPERAEESR